MSARSIFFALGGLFTLAGVTLLTVGFVSASNEAAELAAQNQVLTAQVEEISERADECEEALSVMHEVSVELRAGGTIISELLGDVAAYGPMGFSQAKADRGLDHIEMANGLAGAVSGMCNG